MRTLIVLCLGIILHGSSYLVIAQDSSIGYGDVVTGEITDATFEVPYQFEGQAGDVIVIEMRPVDILGDMDIPSVIVLDSEQHLLWSVYGFSAAVLAGVLPADGEYTILATRNDGRAGDSVGEYFLRLIKAEEMIPGETITDVASSEIVEYYSVGAPGTFTIEYNKLGGEFSPTIDINVITNDSELDAVASLNGELLGSGTIGVQPQSNLQTEIFVVAVQEGLFEYNYDEVSVDYTLTLVIPESQDIDQ